MFYRKISEKINAYLNEESDRILCIDGARQVGKTFIIRELAKKKYKNYIELNMANDMIREQRFRKIRSIEDFFLQVSITDGDKMGTREDTIIFIDEIQVYPELLTLLKPLREDNRFKYICSGSELGIAMADTTLIPMGSIQEVKMYPMDFEEFLLANSVGNMIIAHLRQCFEKKEALGESLHEQLLNLFKTYLYVGGLPAAVKAYVETRNVFEIKEIQSDTIRYYKEDASKYDREHKLKIEKIYDFIPSNLENKVKRIQFKKIENIDDARYLRYQDEFEYLISSGIALETLAISEPKFPLLQSSSKKLVKLYLNDVGLLSYFLYRNNINAVLEDKRGVNLGAVYETVVAQELKAHGHDLFYYDRKNVGEVDFLLDDYDNLSILPLEIKSGTNERNFKAIAKIVDDSNYRITRAYVFSNKREITSEGKITFLPIYFVMFL